MKDTCMINALGQLKDLREELFHLHTDGYDERDYRDSLNALDLIETWIRRSYAQLHPNSALPEVPGSLAE